MSNENNVTENTTTMPTPKSKKPAKNTYFEPLTDQTMVEKVRLTVELHNKNYFIGASETEIQLIEKAIRPCTPIPSNYISTYRDSYNKNKKLAWVMEHINDPCCTEFKNNYTTQRTLAEVIALASKIYSINCEDYKRDKVRKGENAVKRPRPASPTSITALSTNDNEENTIAAKNLNNAIIREAFDNDANDTFLTLETIARMDKSEVIKFLESPNDDVKFAKKIAKINEITTDLPLYKLKAIGSLAIMRSALGDITENDIN
jgi:hypothetical protein